MQPSHALPSIIFVAFILFALYRRFRRSIGRQKVHRKWFIARIILLVFSGCVIVATSLSAVGPLPLVGALIGFGVGAAAALYALRLMEFERDEDEVYFTPNPYIGLALSALFIARLVYRFVFQGLLTSNSAPLPLTPSSSPPAGVSDPGIQQAFDPITVSIIFVLFGYYVFYYLGILRQSRELEEREG